MLGDFFPDDFLEAKRDTYPAKSDNGEGSQVESQTIFVQEAFLIAFDLASSPRKRTSQESQA